MWRPVPLLLGIREVSGGIKKDYHSDKEADIVCVHVEVDVDVNQNYSR